MELHILLPDISDIRHYPYVRTALFLVASSVLLQFVYFNTRLSGCHLYLLNKLQKFQNYAVRLILQVRNEIIEILVHMCALHWLPVQTHTQNITLLHSASGV